MLKQTRKELATKNTSLKEKLSFYMTRCEQLERSYDRLQHQVKELLRCRFGSSSERFMDSSNPQDDFFTTSLPIETEQEETESNVSVASYTRRKDNKRLSVEDLPHRAVVIPLSDDQKTCPCGRCKQFVRYETTELLHHQPELLEIIEEKREIWACPRGCGGSLIVAPKPMHALPHVGATEEMLANIVVSKLQDRQPLYHLEKKYHEVVSRQTLARWFIDTANVLQPLVNLCKDEIVAYDIAAVDGTTLQVLREPGRAAEMDSTVYCIRGGYPGREVICYEYNAVEHKAFLRDCFDGFQGSIHGDASPHYEVFEDTGIVMSYCNAHARRKFEPIAKGAKGDGLAKHAMRFYRALYKIEKRAKDKEMTAEQRYALRQKESKPLVEKFTQWVDDITPTTLSQSPIGKALSYECAHREGLYRFLEDGRLEADNNLTEQQIKPFVIDRKNFLFACSVEGAKALCGNFTLLRTAIWHGLDPYPYFVFALKQLPYCKTVEDYEKLLPFNVMQHKDWKNHDPPK